MLVLVAAALLIAQDQGDIESEKALLRLRPVFNRAARAKTLHCIHKDTIKRTAHEYWLKKPDLMRSRDMASQLEVVTGPSGTFARERGGEWQRAVERSYFFVPGLYDVFKEFFDVAPYGAPPYASREIFLWNGRKRKVIRWDFASGEPMINHDTAFFDARTLRLMLVEQRTFMYLDIPEGEVFGRHFFPVLRWNEPMKDSLFGPAAKQKRG